MGVSEDINWLKVDDGGVGKVFTLIAGKQSLKIRELKDLFGSKDWWPLKAHIVALVSRGLVVEVDGVYKLTDDGKKVLDGFKAMEVVKAI